MKKYVLILLSGGLLAFALLHVSRAQQIPSRPGPPAPPARPPYEDAIACTGLVEPENENISVGSPVEGIVVEVLVKVGQRVKANAPLFRLEDRSLQAELHTRRADLAAAEAQLKRLENQPRREELPPSQARINEARANLAALEDKLGRTEQLVRDRASSPEDLVTVREAVAAARAQLERAEADYRLLAAGAWGPDKKVARAAVNKNRTLCRQTETEIDRRIVRAQTDGEVLQVNVRPGEFVGARPGQALILLGQVCQLHVRIDIDEHDIPRFRRGAAGRAVVRGNPGQEFPLKFVRVEPFVVPKRNLAGDTPERVDTRVLQVIYALPFEVETLYVGQPMDVFIEVGGPIQTQGEEER
jgi:multidrug resistance efflux pump